MSADEVLDLAAICPECGTRCKLGWHDCPEPDCDGRPRPWVSLRRYRDHEEVISKVKELGSLTKAGKYFGLTSERIRQICVQYGIGRWDYKTKAPVPPHKPLTKRRFLTWLWTVGFRYCHQCERAERPAVKTLEEFSKGKTSTVCKACAADSKRARYRKNPAAKIYIMAYNKAHPEYQKRYYTIHKLEIAQRFKDRYANDPIFRAAWLNRQRVYQRLRYHSNPEFRAKKLASVAKSYRLRKARGVEVGTIPPVVGAGEKK